MNIVEFFKKVGVELLDQPQLKNKEKSNGKAIDDFWEKQKDNFNPSKELISKVLCKLARSRAPKAYEISQVCGFTLTLKKKYHDCDDMILHRKIYRTIHDSIVWKDKAYILFPEYTKKGVLHYHGVMWNEYEADVMRCVKWWRRKYGYAKPELQIRNRENWIKYIIKDYGNTGLFVISNKVNLFY